MRIACLVTVCAALSSTLSIDATAHPKSRQLLRGHPVGTKDVSKMKEIKSSFNSGPFSPTQSSPLGPHIHTEKRSSKVRQSHGNTLRQRASKRSVRGRTRRQSDHLSNKIIRLGRSYDVTENQLEAIQAPGTFEEGAIHIEPMYRLTKKKNILDSIIDLVRHVIDPPQSHLGPLVGPFNFPGVGDKIYVRLLEPIHSNQVVIRLITEVPAPEIETSFNHNLLASSTLVENAEIQSIDHHSSPLISEPVLSSSNQQQKVHPGLSTSETILPSGKSVIQIAKTPPNIISQSEGKQLSKDASRNSRMFKENSKYSDPFKAPIIVQTITRRVPSKWYSGNYGPQKMVHHRYRNQQRGTVEPNRIFSTQLKPVKNEMDNNQFYQVHKMVDAPFHPVHKVEDASFHHPHKVEVASFHHPHKVEDESYHHGHKMEDASFHHPQQVQDASIHHGHKMKDAPFHHPSKLKDAPFHHPSKLEDASFHHASKIEDASFHRASQMEDIPFRPHHEYHHRPKFNLHSSDSSNENMSKMQDRGSKESLNPVFVFEADPSSFRQKVRNSRVVSHHDSPPENLSDTGAAFEIIAPPILSNRNKPVLLTTYNTIRPEFVNISSKKITYFTLNDTMLPPNLNLTNFKYDDNNNSKSTRNVRNETRRVPIMGNQTWESNKMKISSTNLIKSFPTNNVQGSYNETKAKNNNTIKMPSIPPIMNSTSKSVAKNDTNNAMKNEGEVHEMNSGLCPNCKDSKANEDLEGVEYEYYAEPIWDYYDDEEPVINTTQPMKPSNKTVTTTSKPQVETTTKASIQTSSKPPANFNKPLLTFNVSESSSKSVSVTSISKSVTNSSKLLSNVSKSLLNFSKPLTTASKLQLNANKSSSNFSKPLTHNNVSITSSNKSATIFSKSLINSSTSSTNYKKPFTYPSIKLKNANKLATNLSVPLTSTNKPLTTFSKPVTTSKPLTTFSKPLTSTTKSLSNFSKAAINFRNSLINSSKPLIHFRKLSMNFSKPRPNLYKRPANFSKPLTSIDKPPLNSTEPLTNITTPLTNVSNPLTNVNKPLTNITKPSINFNKSSTNLTKLLDLKTKNSTSKAV